ncbi:MULTISPECIES: hypothetical protein [unclassified Roseovarius]|uniref:hypothetical protein n=1 Tax=unclassified Roseovarius TaxID=2614913 RepID=UPI00273DF284|nr:hypothetical protein [Roseovarius sp. MMSF_3350]
MPPLLAVSWKPALRLGAGLLVMALTTPQAGGAAMSCDPRFDRLPPPAHAVPPTIAACAQAR